MSLKVCHGQVRQTAREIQVKAVKELVQWSHDLNMGPGTSMGDHMEIQIIIIRI